MSHTAPPTASPAGPARTGRGPGQKLVVSVVFVVAMFMTVLDTTIVNVALPAIAADFGESPDNAAGVNVGFLVSLAIFIPAAGWLGDRFGTKRVFLAALTIFTAASALCGAAWDLTSLTGFRVLQGVGGGLLTPVGMAMMMRTFPPAERMRASRVMVVPTALAPALGPIVGGLMVEHLSWHWVFYINVPFGLAAIVFGLLFLADERDGAAGRFDLPGFVLAGAGLAGTLYALTEGSNEGWTSPLILVTGLAGLAMLGALVVVERRSSQPMLDLGVFRDRLFRDSSMVTATISAGYLGAVFVLPLMVQQGRGLSAVDSGLTTCPAALGVIIGTQLVSRYYWRIGPRRLTAAGLAAAALLLASLALVGPGSSLWWVRGILFTLGLFMSHVFMPSQTAAFATIEPRRMGGASTLFNVQRQLGAAVGVAVLGGVLAGVGVVDVTPAGPVPNYDAYRWAFVVAGCMAAVGVVFALLVRDRDAAATMQPPPGKAPVRDRAGEDEPATGRVS